MVMYKTIECNYMATNKNINRIKVVLVEKKKTNKWLADQIGKDQATVSKWCTNTTQSTLETLVEIAKILEVDIRELLGQSNLLSWLRAHFPRCGTAYHRW